VFRYLAPFFCILLFSLPVKAETAQELLSYCDDSSPGTLNAGLCLGLLSGAVEALDVNHTLGGHCYFQVPDRVTRGQILKIFRNYADKHPEELHFNYKTVLVSSLREVFPCSEAK
jgi:hypothetical protein